MFLFLIFLFLKFILNFNLTIRRYKKELKKKDLATQIYSETLELFSPTEPNRNEPNRIKHGFAGSEFFQYFYVSVRSNRTRTNSIRFDIPGKF